MGFSYSSKLYGAGGATIGDNGFVYDPATDTLSVATGNFRNVVVTALATPTITSPLVVNGTPGATTYGYKRVSYLADGTSTAASAEVTIATGNATLDATNSITISWPAVTGSVSERIYRTTGGAAPPKLIYTGTALTFTDVGAAGTAQTPATSNGTGRVLVGDGSLAAPGVAFTSAPTTGFALSAGNLQFAIGGALAWQFTTTQLWNNSNSSNLVFGTSADRILTFPAAATLQLGAANVTGAVAPVAQTLTVQSVGTTATADLAGSDWTHKGSFGKGTAASGKHIFTVGTPQNTTVAHTSSTVLTLQDTGTAGTAAPQALFADGTAAKPSISFVTPNTSGFYTDGTGILWANAGIKRGGFIGSNMNLATDAGSVIIGTSADLHLTRPAAATLQLGAAASATPVAQTLQAQGSRGGTDTDVAGANLTIRPGAGTGAATGSSIVFQTPNTTTTGTTAQTQVTRVSIGQIEGASFALAVVPSTNDARTLGNASQSWQSVGVTRATLGSKTKAITDGSATAFATFTIADGATYAGEVIYKVKAVKGTALQALAGRVRFAATREGAVYTTSISEVGTQTLAAAAGTLTGSISIAGTGGVITFSANFDTSQASPDTFTIDARFDSPDSALALTFP